MSIPASIDQLAAPSGAIPSHVALGGIQYLDHNAFITALAVRALSHSDAWTPLRNRALDFLETCEDRDMEKSFRFWPPGQEPSWGAGRPPDADDTAIIAVELVRSGRRSLTWLRRVALQVLNRHRVQFERDIRPPWIHDGAFHTWLVRDHPNVVDAVVNTNVAALFAKCGLKHAASYTAGIRLISAAVAWTGGHRERVRIVAPYYPHPAEFREALLHAIRCGAEELLDPLAKWNTWFPPTDHLDGNQPICSGAHGEAIWTSPPLQRIRMFTRRAYTPQSQSGVRSPLHGSARFPIDENRTCAH